jgi:hypothetical protein
MGNNYCLNLAPRITSGAKITPLQPEYWRLEIPAGEAGKYRLAQLDDYGALPRKKFLWKPPITLCLKARASSNDIPGTWGFGFWNDPFAVALGVRGGNQKMPTLPNTAWFFMASPPNHLSIKDHLPGQGNLAGVFQSPILPGIVLTPALIGLPLLLIPSFSRVLRKWANLFIRQDAQQFTNDYSTWHDYQIEWDKTNVNFFLDNQMIFHTTIVPKGPLGLVIWIDNQFASWMEDGRIGMGTLQNPEPVWIEVRDLRVE